MRFNHYLNILRLHPKPIRLLMARLLVLTGLCRMITIEQDGYRLRFHPSNLSEQLWMAPNSRKDALEFFRAYLKPGDLVIDVGANIGDTALTSSLQIGDNGKIWAVEPHPRTFAFLTANINLNHALNIAPINCAVGEAIGEVTFADDRRDDMNRVGNGSLKVPVRRLDEIVDCRDAIALLKVDVEGYELPVFAGASEILDRVSTLHFEISRQHFSWFGYEIGDLLQLLESKGFQLFRFQSNHHLAKINSTYTSDNVENLIGMKDPSMFEQRTGWAITE